MTIYRYRIDIDDTLQFVSPEWVEFGRRNAAADLAPSAVLGRSLWEFITDYETRHLYRQLFAKVRTDGRPRMVPFRCDSPTCRRYMRLTVSRLDGGALELSSELLREEPRDPVALVAAETPRSDAFLRMCAWCKRVRVNHDWLEVEEAIAQLNLFAAPTLPQITHSLCSECHRRVIDELET